MINYDETPIKLTIYDKVIIFVIVVSFLIFLNINIVMAIFLVTSILLVITNYYLNNEKFRNKAIKVLNVVMILTILLAIADTILTHIAVNHYKFAYEGNPIVVFLWAKFGIVLGEIIRILTLTYILFIIKIKINGENKLQSYIGGAILLFAFLSWIFVVYWNGTLLYDYLCNG